MAKLELSSIPPHVYAWMVHQLRLLGRVSARQAKARFGVGERHLRKWVAAYQERDRQPADPEVELKVGYGRAKRGLVYLAKDGTGSEKVGDVVAMTGARDVPLSTPQALAFLDVLRGHCLLAKHAPDAHDSATFLPEGFDEPLVCEVGAPAHPRIDGEAIPLLLSAMLQKKPVLLDYVTKKGERTLRTLSPHRFIMAGGVYHFRAYDHEQQRCMDFNPARAFSVSILHDRDHYLFKGPWMDKEWGQLEDLCFRVRSEIMASKYHLDALRRTYEVEEGGIVRVRTRRALAYYVERQVLSYTLRKEDGEEMRAFELCRGGRQRFRKE